MKTLKTTVLTFSLLVACVLVKAELPNKSSKNANGVLDAYVESVTKGNIQDVEELLGDDFKQYVNGDKKSLNFNKRQFMRQLTLSEDYAMNCTADYSFMEKKENFVIAKVDMKYPGFTKTDYLTMNHTAEGWQITSISVHYN